MQLVLVCFSFYFLLLIFIVFNIIKIKILFLSSFYYIKYIWYVFFQHKIFYSYRLYILSKFLVIMICNYNGFLHLEMNLVFFLMLQYHQASSFQYPKNPVGIEAYICIHYIGTNIAFFNFIEFWSENTFHHFPDSKAVIYYQ